MGVCMNTDRFVIGDDSWARIAQQILGKASDRDVKSTWGDETSDLKENKTPLNEISKVGDSNNAAVQESGNGYSRRFGLL